MQIVQVFFPTKIKVGCLRRQMCFVDRERGPLSWLPVLIHIIWEMWMIHVHADDSLNNVYTRSYIGVSLFFSRGSEWTAEVKWNEEKKY